ncbi:hypothetical protein PG993_011380 [Apiospora rasikravindrae]|uniref:Uncharacterized protein n=1 Tax=Apiospora rasikravindrae TaxID=990691 RepID=A0ABR1SFV4_9PEZI
MANNSPYRQQTVWYIDNVLPLTHPMFNNAPVHYEEASQQYAQHADAVSTAGADSGINFLSMSQPPPPRSEYTNLRAMKFWGTMFAAAMEKFRSTADEHKRRDAKYNIHSAKDWDAVYSTLELARDEYQKQGGAIGWWRRVRRKAADNVTPLQGMTAIASKMTPDDPYSTPVLGAVGMLLDAAKQAATVRKKVAETFDGEGFENLIPIFSDVELFLGEMYSRDRNIYNASLELTVTTLRAVDRTIGFYTSNELFRGGKAVVMRGDYEKELIDSLKDISTKSAKLMEEAKKSHMHELHLCRIMMGTIEATVVHGFNNMENLLTGYFTKHLTKKDAIIEQKDAALQEANKQLTAANERSLFLMAENVSLRSVSPAFPSAWQPPALQAPAYALSTPALIQAPKSHINQERLQEMFEMPNVDQVDMDFIFNREMDFPARQRLQTEQIIHQALFADWIVSPFSSKLLVQWETPRPRTVADLSPLSLFCAKLVQTLSAQERFMSIQWFCGRHLRQNSDVGAGGHAMLVSMIVQLLREHRGGFDMQALSQSHDLPALTQSQDTDGLICLLEWLVRALPRTVTLFCLVDGVVLYERREHWDAAKPVLVSLLDLADDPTIEATVKVLFMSTPGPPAVRGAFEEERLIVNVETFPHLAGAPSDARFARELGEELSP